MTHRVHGSGHTFARTDSLPSALVRHRRLLEGALWAAIVLGGIAFFFWLIWDPPI